MDSYSDDTDMTVDMESELDSDAPVPTHSTASSDPFQVAGVVFAFSMIA